MKWTMPEIEGKKRWEVKPCVVILDNGELVEDVAVIIAKTAIQTCKPAGLGLPAGIFQEGELIPEDVIKSLKEVIIQERKISLDYYQGRPVKLDLYVIDSKTFNISLNSWTDRLPLEFAPMEIPREAIDDMENVLQIASGQKEMPQSTPKGEILDDLLIALGALPLHNKGKDVEAKDDVIPENELKEKISPVLFDLLRSFGKCEFRPSLNISVPKNDFFFCSLRNEQMGIPQQERELKKENKILCVGCSRANAMDKIQPRCVGHMIRSAWERTHRRR